MMVCTDFFKWSGENLTHMPVVRVLSLFRYFLRHQHSANSFDVTYGMLKHVPVLVIYTFHWQALKTLGTYYLLSGSFL